VLLFGLDTFGEDLHPEVVGEGDDAGDELQVGDTITGGGVGGETADEGSVDLDLSDRKCAEISEAGVTGAEIVQGDFSA